MSHMVQMSNANGPAVVQNGLSSGGEARLDQRVVERGAEDRALVGRTRPRPQPCRGGRATRPWVRARRRRSDRARRRTPRRRFARACSHPRSENPMPQLDRLPGSRRAHEHQPERPQRRRPDAVEVEAGAARRSAAGRTRASAASRGRRTPGARPAAHPRRRSRPGRPPGASVASCARSGTVRPCGMARPPSEKSMTSRASRCAGKVYRWTADFGPTVSSQRTPELSVAA